MDMVNGGGFDYTLPNGERNDARSQLDKPIAKLKQERHLTIEELEEELEKAKETNPRLRRIMDQK